MFQFHTVASKMLEPPIGLTSYVKEGNNITFRCVGEGYPSPLVKWRRVNGLLSGRTSTTSISMLTNRGNETRITAELIFTGTHRRDTASYECSVSNLLNAVTRSTILIVQCMLHIINVSKLIFIHCNIQTEVLICVYYICHWICKKGSYTRNYKYLEIQF